MSSLPFPTEEELSSAFVRLKMSLIANLRRRFRLTLDQAEDVVQDTWVEAVSMIRRRMPLKNSLDALLRWLTCKRAIDLLRHDLAVRKLEEEMFARLLCQEDRPSIGSEVAEEERRGRQGRLLSELYQEFCSECESKPEQVLRKEIYERTNRGQPVAQIAESLGLTHSQVVNERRAARKWFEEQILRDDPNRSIFETLYRRVYAEDGEIPPSPTRQAVSVPGLEVFEPGLPSLEAGSTIDVVRWVIEVARGFCPNPGRLLEWSNRPEAEEYRDVQYHVVEAGCTACRRDLDLVKGLDLSEEPDHGTTETA